MNKKMVWNPTTKTVRLLPEADAVPGGFVSLGVAHHDDVGTDEIDYTVSHVWFHHVQEALYKQKKVQDMQSVTILMG